MATQSTVVERPDTPEDVQKQEPWSLYRPIRRWLFLGILFLAILCSMTDRYLMSVLLEPIKREFGASDTVMGALTGFAFAALYAVLGLPVARWADRGDRRLIISLALAIWSLMSALCGLATSLPMLALARVGVGIGEAGALPPSMSLVADYFPPAQRGRSVSVLLLANVLGILIAYYAGAQIAAAHGWRSAFLWLSVPGIPLALVAYLLLDEPRRRSANVRAVEMEAVGTATRALLRKRSLVYVMLGAAVYSLVVVGAFLWLPAYLVRVLHVNLASREGALYGLVAVVVPLVGTSFGGWLADRLAKRSLRWLCWLPALGMGIALPLYELMFLTNSYPIFIACSLAAGVALSITVPAVLTVMLAVAGAQRRSFAFAIYGLLSSFLGMGLGPLLTGALSDGLAVNHGVDGLRYALMIVTAVLAIAVLLFAAAARDVANDAES